MVSKLLIISKRFGELGSSFFSVAAIFTEFVDGFFSSPGYCHVNLKWTAMKDYVEFQQSQKFYNKQVILAQKKSHFAFHTGQIIMVR